MCLFAIVPSCQESNSAFNLTPDGKIVCFLVTLIVQACHFFLPSKGQHENKAQRRSFNESSS